MPNEFDRNNQGDGIDRRGGEVLMMRRTHLLIILVLIFAGAAFAEDVGTVASLRGQAGINRGGARVPTEVGTVVQLGDELGDVLDVGVDGNAVVSAQDDRKFLVGDTRERIVGKLG